MKRLGKDYVKVKQKTIDPKRHLAEDPNIIQAWFDRIEIAMDKYNIIPSNIWNFDESDFQNGQGGDEAAANGHDNRLRHVSRHDGYSTANVRRRRDPGPSRFSAHSSGKLAELPLACKSSDRDSSGHSYN